MKKKKNFKEPNPKGNNQRRAERRREARRAKQEDPVIERIKQVYEVTHRNQVTSAALRFWFGRLCKIRQDSTLTSLPIQYL